MVAAIGWLNPSGLVFFYLPVWYLGIAAAQAENFLEHYSARPGDRTADSVSCYGSLYNLLRFNHGYHQEHHYRPQVHWTRVPELKHLLPPESDRRVVRWAHWFNFAARREVRIHERAAERQRPFVEEAQDAGNMAAMNATSSALEPWLHP